MFFNPSKALFVFVAVIVVVSVDSVDAAATSFVIVFLRCLLF